MNIALGIGSIWLLQSDLLFVECTAAVRRRGDQRVPKTFLLLSVRIQSSFSRPRLSSSGFKNTTRGKKTFLGYMMDWSEPVQHLGFVQVDSCLKNPKHSWNSSYPLCPASCVLSPLSCDDSSFDISQRPPPPCGSLMRNIQYDGAVKLTSDIYCMQWSNPSSLRGLHRGTVRRKQSQVNTSTAGMRSEYEVRVENMRKVGFCCWLGFCT